MKALAVLTLVTSSTTAWAGPEMVGKKAPGWTLERLSDGNEVKLAQFLGKPIVVVMATTREGAEPSKEWMLTLERNFRGTEVQVLQVAVLDNPWYIPKFAVRDMLTDFTPKHGHRLLLMDWGRDFRDRYGLPKDAIPQVALIDRTGVIRFWRKGNMNDETLLEVLERAPKL